MAELKTRVLIVDDDQRLRDLLVPYLGEQGFETRAVADAPAMDRQLARERYDLIVLDLMLPGEDGLALVRAVRSRGIRTPLIALTAHAGAKMRVRALMAGFNTYIPKPVEPAELTAVIVQQAGGAKTPGV